MNRSNTSSPSAGATGGPQPTPQTPVATPAPNLPSRNSTGPTGGGATVLLTRSRLQELIKEVDPNEQLDEDVEELLLQSMDEFVEELVSNACDAAKHRKGTQLEVQDVQLILERKMNMWIPGFMGAEENQAPRKSFVTEAHKQRMAVIRKTLKK